MNPLKDRILRTIRECGPMPLAEFMEFCLLDPDHGYYCGDTPLGAAGSFTTAPEISQMFGELIGLAIGQAWLDQGAPESFALVELGPGRGTLMADLLRATGKIPGFNQSARILLVERSPSLRQCQASALAGHDPTWCSHVGELPGMPLFLVANEFFDALPIRQFRLGDGGWRETLVGHADGQLAYTMSDPVVCRELTARQDDVDIGGMIELRPVANRIISRLADLIRCHGGAAVIVDYGEMRPQGDTFQALRDHRTADPLADPGRADLTSHVDFSALAGAAGGVAVTPLITQQAYLTRLGIRQRAQILAGAASGSDLQNHVQGCRRLINPEAMGTLFKVMGLNPVGAPTLAGFAS